jgi:hypothetical protein
MQFSVLPDDVIDRLLKTCFRASEEFPRYNPQLPGYLVQLRQALLGRSNGDG